MQATVDGVNWSKSTYSQKIEVPKKITETLFFKILIPLVVGFIIFILSKRYYDQKRKKVIAKQEQEHEIINLQLANVKSQLNPHFIFNVMNGIGSDLIKSSDETTYKNYADMCKLIRKSMDHAKTPVKTINEELQFVKEYLNLQKYRFYDKFTYKLHIDRQVDVQFLIPKMCIQILVENVLKHVVEKENRKIKIDIFIRKVGGDLTLSVKDNGSGFKQKDTNYTGKGLAGVKKMIKIYNKHNVKSASLNIKTSSMGSEVVIVIPKGYTFLLKNKNKANV